MIRIETEVKALSSAFNKAADKWEALATELVNKVTRMETEIDHIKDDEKVLHGRIDTLKGNWKWAIGLGIPLVLNMLWDWLKGVRNG